MLVSLLLITQKMHLSTQTESLQKHNTRIACREYTDQGLKTKNQLYSGSPLRHATALSKRQTDAFRLWGKVTLFHLPKYTMFKCNHEHLLANKITLISKTGGRVSPTPSPASMLWPWASPTCLCSPTNSWRQKKENYCFWFLICDCLLIFYHQPVLDCLLVVCWLFNSRMLLLVNSHQIAVCVFFY